MTVSPYVILGISTLLAIVYVLRHVIKDIIVPPPPPPKKPDVYNTYRTECTFPTNLSVVVETTPAPKPKPKKKEPAQPIRKKYDIL